jgi:hypothetical protein
MTTHGELKAKTGTSLKKDAKDAVQEIFTQIQQEDMEAVLFFCSSKYDLDLLGKELKAVFPCKLIGCTTAGEISSAGYQKGGMVAVSISSPRLKIHPRLVSPLDDFDAPEAQKLAESLQQDFVFTKHTDRSSVFGFLLIDGMSAGEESIIATLYHQFGGISITGGSAGDDLCFQKTHVYWDGTFLSNAAVFSLFETTLPFYVFQTLHFKPTEKKLVITDADPSRRLVTEINAAPAAGEYARMLGISPADLSPGIFSKHPVMIKIGDRWFVRSIQKANEDGSLSFYCAIDIGLVLTIAEGHDIITDLKSGLERILKRIPKPGLFIACDCVLRKLEILEKGLAEDLKHLVRKLNIVGFNTYGEQFDSIHINQTLTGVVIGSE